MVPLVQEIVELFEQLTPNNQAQLLTATRVALVAETSMKKTLMASCGSGAPVPDSKADRKHIAFDKETSCLAKKNGKRGL